MSLILLKRQCLIWGATLLGIVISAVIGLALAIWMGDNHQVAQPLLQQLPWGWWRVLLYTGLLLMWPQAVQCALRQRCYSSLALKLNQSLSRRPLIVLILCYELLVVRNPLAALIR